MSIVAAIQMASGPNVGANLLEAERLITQAAAEGANLVVLPENFALMGEKDGSLLSIVEEEGTGPLQSFLAQQAARNKLWLVGGTIPLRAIATSKVRAACLLFDANGKCVARYDKFHLFDVVLPGGEERYCESLTIEPGQNIVVADTPFGQIGLAICYDLRFPELFRALVEQGMEVLVLPSAFTAITGKAHWEPLVRARAIENLCYVVAAGQGGFHISGRTTYGDSMIVDPWGVVLARLPRGSGVITAELDSDRLHNTRRNFPAIEHRRFTCKLVG
ncbi:nitrilase/cyanide hydratase and apolipoprotein N-acyltransferase [Candidatus Nitrosoglobus terrae]|uniref:Nitrilase/cyanide hydratase and apolipoprotein N-acyltransferase n=1 Tax=Candidatus Nitrosoglobus terrae TaxID=1630141 RepID=A0A1Q2SLA8_9GAMM|nr:carbon-nitrogen hydrolase family protein [Candidatus Nitrosoglobus terrae]BAW79910.1 nitrilase/cyanide hydratase and apolipoprotein N-acyltransferase [Candidatus Nitrosoglobus terrae]